MCILYSYLYVPRKSGYVLRTQTTKIQEKRENCKHLPILLNKENSKINSFSYFSGNTVFPYSMCSEGDQTTFEDKKTKYIDMQKMSAYDQNVNRILRLAINYIEEGSQVLYKVEYTAQMQDT